MASHGMKTYCKSRIELRNTQIFKIMLQKSRQFLSSEQPYEPKSLDVSFSAQELKEYSRKAEGHSIRILNERSGSDSRNLRPLWLLIHSIRDTIYLQYSWPWSSELYFARYCVLKRTGTFVSESNVTCLIWLILRSDDLRIPSWHQSVSTISLRLRKVEFFK